MVVASLAGKTLGSAVGVQDRMKRWLARIVVLASLFTARSAFATLSVPGNVVDDGNVAVNATTTVTVAISSDGVDNLDHFDLVGANCPRFTITPASPLPHMITVATPMNIDVQLAPLARGAVSC